MNKYHIIAASIVSALGLTLSTVTFAAQPSAPKAPVVRAAPKAPAVRAAVTPPAPVDVQQEGEHEGQFGSDVNEPGETPEGPEAPEVPDVR